MNTNNNSAQSSGLFVMLCMLTMLFVAAQLSFFFIHYKVSSFIDSLANSAIAHEMFHSIILFPLLVFFILQLIAYFLFVVCMWWIAVSFGKFFQLSSRTTYHVGLSCWLLGCTAIFLLNNYYFPDSYFAEIFQQYEWLSHFSNMILVVMISILMMVGSFACFHFCYLYPYRALAASLLLLIMWGVCMNFFSAAKPSQNTTQPNIILIGLDSLRPDFTSYFGNQAVHTPHIDQFLSSATTFTHAYTPLARTFPAWISLLTAKYPKHHYARINLAASARVVRNDTLAKKLKAAGYYTIYGTDEVRFTDITSTYGFDRVIGPKGGAVEFLLAGLTDFPLTNLLVNLPFAWIFFPYNYGNRAAEITYEPEKFLQLVKLGLAQRANKPIFLAMHLCLAHWPFTWARDQQAKNLILPERYAQSVEAVDKQLGELLNILQAQGLLQHSLVVLLSDHGTTVGMENDRIVSVASYRGDKNSLQAISSYRLSAASSDSWDRKKTYSITTSYGQGTDVLSLKQYQVLLGFKGFGLTLPTQTIQQPTSLLDVAPTILDFLHLTALSKADGVSLAPYFSRSLNSSPSLKPFFIETADTIADIETDKIFADKIIKQMIYAYRIDPATGLLFVNPLAEQSIIKSKQRAVLFGDWLLARYPAHARVKLVPVPHHSPRLQLISYAYPAYFVLVNIKNGLWTVGLSTPFAKKAPVKKLLSEFKRFYGDEV